MAYTLSFGKYEGRTFEWLFFNAPWYARWIYENRIHRQEHNMDEAEGDYFRELYRRACALSGICNQCHERPITYLGLSWQHNGALGMVGYYCDDCEYTGGSVTAYHPASFFVDARELGRGDQKRITKEIRRTYIGADDRLTQAKMDEFFHNDANFSDATPGFFKEVPA